MSISQHKKEFIKYLTGGISVFMNSSMLADEIYLHQDDDVEMFIKQHLLHGSSFSENKLNHAIDSIDDNTLTQLLKYFDDRDITIANAYIESSIASTDIPEHLSYLTDHVNFKEVTTFQDFINI